MIAQDIVIPICLEVKMMILKYLNKYLNITRNKLKINIIKR